MKKFFLLMALAFLAGAVNAQNTPNFGARANLKQALKLSAAFPDSHDEVVGSYHDNAIKTQTGTDQNGNPTYTYSDNLNGTEIVCHTGWTLLNNDLTQREWRGELYWSNPVLNGGSCSTPYEVELFNKAQIDGFLSQHSGHTLLDLVENFVIHTDYSHNWSRYYGHIPTFNLVLDGPANGNPKIDSAPAYTLSFYTWYNNDYQLVGEMTFWKGDAMIAPLRAIIGTNSTLNGQGDYQKGQPLPDNYINDIRKVTIKGASHDGRIKVGDAYFISAIPGLDFNDKDGVDIGNAYIDPSFLIPSNRLWIDIKSDRSFYINARQGAEDGVLYFSLPYKTGIDMSDVSFHQIDFDRTLNVFSRYIVENKIKNGTDNTGDQHITVRDLYNSRYSGAFYDQSVTYHGTDAAIMGATSEKPKAIQHINSIYWQMYGMNTDVDRSVWVQDICFTKNRIEARTTRKGLALEDFPNPNAWGFRNREYPVQPYYNGMVQESWGEYEDWSDIIRGDWNKDNTYNYTDLSKYNKMRIIGSPNTKFVIRYATELEGTTVVDGVTYHTIKGGADGWKEFVCKTDKRGPINENLYGSGEVNIDLDVLKAGTGHLYLQCVRFDGLEGVHTQLGNSNTPGLRSNYWCNNVELFEGEGRLVDLVGSTNPNDTGNMFHVWNNDNNYQWQYATVVRWAAHGNDNWQANFQQVNYSEESPINCSDGQLIWGANGMYPENYADLTGYKKLRIYGDSGSARIVLNVMRNGSAPYLNTTSSYLKKNGEDGQRVEKNIVIDSSKGYAELDLSNYEYVHLHGIKVSWGSSISGLKSIKLVEDEESSYIFYGNGSYGEQGHAPISYSARMAANDLTATVIDARARCNNMQVPYPDKYPNSNEVWFGWVEHITLPQTASQNVLFISRNDQFNRRKIGDHVEYQTQMPTKVVDGTRVNRLDETPTILYNPDNIIRKTDYVMDDKDGEPLFGSDVILYNNEQPKTKIVDDIDDFNLLEVSGDENVNEYTCTNLKLVDGLSFYAPKKIKAEHAQYTRTFNNANTVNTIIIPFAVDAGSETGKKSAGFYVATNTLQSVVTTNGEKNMVGILGEQTVKEGDWLLQFRKYTGTTDANVPYLYAVTDGTGENVLFEGVATENGKVIVPETPDVLVEGKRRMSNYDEAKTLVNGEMKEGYYLRGVYEGTYMEDILFYSGGKLYRTPRTTVTPFRTIIHSPIPVINDGYAQEQNDYFGIVETANDVKVVLAFDPDDYQAVAIENVEVDGLFAEDAPIYNVAGQRVNTLEKGIYIVAGKKILVK